MVLVFLCCILLNFLLARLMLFKAEPGTCIFSCVLPKTIFPETILSRGITTGGHNSGGSNPTAPVRIGGV